MLVCRHYESYPAFTTAYLWSPLPCHLLRILLLLPAAHRRRPPSCARAWQRSLMWAQRRLRPHSLNIGILNSRAVLRSHTMTVTKQTFPMARQLQSTATVVIRST